MFNLHWTHFSDDTDEFGPHSLSDTFIVNIKNLSILYDGAKTYRDVCTFALYITAMVTPTQRQNSIIKKTSKNS